MADRIFRIFNPREPKGDPVEKRRAQLRRAQQSYRDRKDKYTKALEAELARARRSEAGLTSEILQLRGKVQILVTLLSRNGISLPPDFNAEGPSHDLPSPEDVSDLASRKGSFAGGQAQRATTSPVNTMQLVYPEESMNQGGTVSGGGNFDLHQHGANYGPRDVGSHAPPLPIGIAITTPAEPSGTTCLSELDPTTVGMEFVLELERPCLGHMHGNPKKPEEPHGHSLTTTSRLQSSLSLPPIDPKHPVPPSFHNAPAALLESLLSLAPSVSADGDVTPIQAWNYIRRQPHFGGYELQSLNKLANRLRDAAKCHGFGAAVQTGVFESAVREILNPASRRIL